MIKDIKTYVLTHTDLDGSGCAILLKLFFNNTFLQRISYSNIYSKLQEIFTEVENAQELPQLVISDLKFSKSDLDFLLQNANKFSEILYIDHHLYDFEIKDIPENVEIIINTEFCATKLTYNYFKDKDEIYTKYKDLVEIINTWDLHIREHEYWERAIELNRLFWYMGSSKFEKRFSFEPSAILDENNSIRDLLQEIKTRIENYFNTQVENKLIASNEFITFSACDEYLGDIKEFFNSLVYVNFYKFHQINIKFSEKLSDADCEELRTKILNLNFKKEKNKGGHLRAFGITLEPLTIEEIQEIYQELETCIENILFKPTSSG